MKRIQIIPHPAYSPDLNAIEMLWKWLDDKLNEEDKKTPTLLYAALQRGFNELTVEDI